MLCRGRLGSGQRHGQHRVGDRSASGTCTDNAGNSATATFSPIKIDKTAPSVVYTSQAPDANAAGWNKTDVTVTFTASDSLSGFAPSGSSKTDTNSSSTEGNPVVVGSPAFTDVAGNTAAAGAATHSLKIDKTAPTISNEGPTTTPNGAGSYNANVVNRFEASDGLSGLDAACALAFPASAGENIQSKTASDEGAAVKVSSASCTDVAGNTTAAMDSAAFKIDKTAPSVVYTSQAPAANAAGWNKTDVTVTFTASDSLSGFAPSGSSKTDTNSSSTRATRSWLVALPSPMWQVTRPPPALQLTA